MVEQGLSGPDEEYPEADVQDDGETAPDPDDLDNYLHPDDAGEEDVDSDAE